MYQHNNNLRKKKITSQSAVETRAHAMVTSESRFRVGSTFSKENFLPKVIIAFWSAFKPFSALIEGITTKPCNYFFKTKLF